MSIKDALRFDRRHILMSNAAHVALGFGLAVLLQEYMAGDSFVPTIVAWVLIVLGLLEHVRAWTSKKSDS